MQLPEQQMAHADWEQYMDTDAHGRPPPAQVPADCCSLLTCLVEDASFIGPHCFAIPAMLIVPC